METILNRFEELVAENTKLKTELREAKDYADKLVEHKDMVCLPADLANLREANAHFAMENHELHKKVAAQEDALRDQKSEIVYNTAGPHHRLVEVQEALRSADRHNHEMLGKLEIVREHRDRLVEALQYLIEGAENLANALDHCEDGPTSADVLRWNRIGCARKALVGMEESGV